MRRLTILLTLLLLLPLSQYGYSGENPHGVKPGQSPFGFKPGEGPLSLPPETDEELRKHNRTGMELYLKKNFKGALKHFQTARNIKPSSGIILYNEAVTLDKLDKHEKATLRFQQAKDHAKGNQLILSSPILQAHLK